MTEQTITKEIALKFHKFTQDTALPGKWCTAKQSAYSDRIDVSLDAIGDACFLAHFRVNGTFEAVEGKVPLDLRDLATELLTGWRTILKSHGVLEEPQAPVASPDTQDTTDLVKAVNALTKAVQSLADTHDVSKLKPEMEPKQAPTEEQQRHAIECVIEGTAGEWGRWKLYDLGIGIRGIGDTRDTYLMQGSVSGRWFVAHPQSGTQNGDELASLINAWYEKEGWL